MIETAMVAAMFLISVTCILVITRFVTEWVQDTQGLNELLHKIEQLERELRK